MYSRPFCFSSHMTSSFWHDDDLTTASLKKTGTAKPNRFSFPPMETEVQVLRKKVLYVWINNKNVNFFCESAVGSQRQFLETPVWYFLFLRVYPTSGCVSNFRMSLKDSFRVPVVLCSAMHIILQISQYCSFVGLSLLNRNKLVQ